MARYGRLVTGAQWYKIRPLLPPRPPRPQGGRPPAAERKVLEGILWIRERLGHGRNIIFSAAGAGHPALGVWVHGDGKGGILNFQLVDVRGPGPAVGEHRRGLYRVAILRACRAGRETLE